MGSVIFKCLEESVVALFNDRRETIKEGFDPQILKLVRKEEVS